MSLAPAAFGIDRDYDRSLASDGISRYGAYLRDATFEPWTDHDQAVEWAAFAWRRATGPVMSPGYVRCHPRVRGAQLERSGWDGGLAAGVTLVSPWPEQLARALARGVRLGEQDAYWQDWPTEYRGGDITCYYEPSEADVAARPYLRFHYSRHAAQGPLERRDTAGAVHTLDRNGCVFEADLIAALLHRLHDLIEPHGGWLIVQCGRFRG